MTISDLIEALKKYPQDASVVVLFKACSEYNILDEQDLTFIPAPADTPVLDYYTHCQYVLRHGMVMKYDKKTWPVGEIPRFLSLLVFPGN